MGTEDTRPNDDSNDDDVPWASPEIQSTYEAALGKFIVAFNQMDNQLTEIIRLVLAKLGRNDLFKTFVWRSFADRVLVLDLLRLSGERAAIAAAPITEMKEIAGERNTLAHGYFDQNPFDGSYKVVNTKKQRQSNYSARSCLQTTGIA